MTGTTTQIMIDLADVFQTPKFENAERPVARLLGMSTNIAIFAAGCAAAAILYAHIGVWCFVVPPVLQHLASLFLRTAPVRETPSTDRARRPRSNQETTRPKFVKQG